MLKIQKYRPRDNRAEYPDKEILHRLYGYTRPYIRYWVVAITCMVVVSGLTSLQAYLIKPVLDEIFIEKNALYFTYLPWILFAIFLLKGIAFFFYEYYLNRVGQSMVRDLRQEIFERMLGQSISFFHRHSTGELMSRILTDVALIQGAVSTAAVGLIKNVLQIVGLVGVIFYLDWRLAIFCSGFLAISFLPMILFSRIYRRLTIRLQQNMGRLSAIMHDSLVGSLIIQAFTAERFKTGRFSNVLKEVFRTQIKNIKARKASSAIMELLGGIGIIAIIVYGGRQVMDGESTTGTFFAFLTALIMTYRPIKGLTQINSVIQQGLAAASRVFWMLDYPPEIQDRSDAEPLPAFAREIRFDDVRFQYPEGKQAVLQGVDLTIRKGQTVALVGHSGSGKTTLANLLPRFMDTEAGKLTIDGRDIRAVTLESLRRQIAVVTQSTVLFDDTVRNNIAYGQTESSMDEVIAAARHANALAFIEALPKGFDTLIGQSGVRLSGGQRQRLAVARAFMKNAPILILDEATSSLDTVSERAVQDAIDHLMAGRTVLVIAHRLTTIERADSIAVLDEGRIVESGSHAELLSREGSKYRALYQRNHSLSPGRS
uniref:ATP-binding cassette, subfamily B, MsbA n=1 Tax=Candidatus Kentrum eta TaxID=2126337 RepID=A0A450UHV8_9GAMM|nr:MAG: ATP-binding cassette, subfamily B, MsbA [Candidatus Kentron sp. H]VFJ92113.1 MAG: ATP-binding cassette, subfamily B, MsbA [Candidatus Kentron sp. H]VFJ98691.1 MAG: ATP-binding cassette, subfamily B, MsbA [Candidatus Kentron sp. H]